MSCSKYCKYSPSTIKLPEGARGSNNDDANMAVANLGGDGNPADAWYAFWGVTAIDDAAHTITVKGGDTYYDSSGGIEEPWNCCGSAPGNGGHRGLPVGAIGQVRWTEIQAGVIKHRLIMAIDNTAESHCFPMTGHEEFDIGDVPGVIPEGAVIKIRGTVNVDSLVSDSEARIIAHALQDYGAVIGDHGSGVASTGLENLWREGSLRPAGAPTNWSNILSADALSNLPFTEKYWRFKQLGYDSSTATVKPCTQ